MSVVAPPVPAHAEPVDRRRGIPGLRGTGVIGHACAAVLLLAVLIALFGPFLAPHDPEQVQLKYSFVGPFEYHYLGFDGQGRDLLSRLLWGARTALLGPLVVVLLAMSVGTFIAITCAWLRGLFDSVASAFLDVLFVFPGILLAVLATAVFGAGLLAASIALAFAYTPYVARVLRSASLRERHQPYIAALEVQGQSSTRICGLHLAPNVLGLIVAQGTILFSYAVVDLAAISFLGLGVQSPQADWGVMVSEGRSGVLQGYPAESLAAGLCIVTVVIAVNLLGERLADRAQGGTR